MTKTLDIIIDNQTEMGEITDHLSEVIDTYVEYHCEYVKADMLGLDSRCGSCYIPPSRDAIIVKDSHNRNYRYYGGFEYIDDEHAAKAGDYTIYSSDSSRVSEAIGRYLDSLDKDEEVTEDNYKEGDL